MMEEDRRRGGDLAFATSSCAMQMHDNAAPEWPKSIRRACIVTRSRTGRKDERRRMPSMAPSIQGAIHFQAERLIPQRDSRLVQAAKIKSQERRTRPHSQMTFADNRLQQGIGRDERIRACSRVHFGSQRCRFFREKNRGERFDSSIYPVPMTSRGGSRATRGSSGFHCRRGPRR